MMPPIAIAAVMSDIPQVVPMEGIPVMRAAIFGASLRPRE